LAIGFVISQPIKLWVLAISLLVGLVALVFMGWCPKVLLPTWARDTL